MAGQTKTYCPYIRTKSIITRNKKGNEKKQYNPRIENATNPKWLLRMEIEQWRNIASY